MAAWTNDELTKIGLAEELEIAPLRPDGTLRKPVTIWVVRLGDDLYVRSVNGRTSHWFRGTEDRREGHVRAIGSAARRTGAKVMSGPAAWTRTCALSKPATTSAMKSRPPTGRSTSGTA